MRFDESPPCFVLLLPYSCFVLLLPYSINPPISTSFYSLCATAVWSVACYVVSG